ncbi:MAG: helix-turn-helix domain-containing protein [Chloroflexota bacterium]|nr:helix-turn-helix domain-containing protein [Chloroflexota bacterium]
MSSSAASNRVEPASPHEPLTPLDPLDLDEDGQPVDDSDSPELPPEAWAHAVPNFLYADVWESVLARRVGELARARRQELELTQEQAATRTGLTQSNLARIERGRHLPTTATLARLAVGLGLAWHVDVTPHGVRIVAERVPPTTA